MPETDTISLLALAITVLVLRQSERDFAARRQRHKGGAIEGDHGST
jgi:hypothetical protein